MKNKGVGNLRIALEKPLQNRGDGQGKSYTRQTQLCIVSTRTGKYAKSPETLECSPIRAERTSASVYDLIENLIAASGQIHRSYFGGDRRQIHRGPQPFASAKTIGLVV
jgi:hypothetical protein